jgi:DNA-binding transcriptional LysR family regulator
MINSRLLHQFIAVAEELHYGRAAIRVRMAQSPLSQAIQRLEEHIGTPLFVRNKRTVSLTSAGKVFLEDAYQWLKYEQNSIERARHASNGEIGRLAIGFIGSVGYGFMPNLIRDFRRDYPNVQLRVLEMTSKDQLEQLKGRVIDVGLLRTPLPKEYSMISTYLYRRDRLMVALPENHPLTKQESVALSQLANETFIAFSKEKVPTAHAQLISLCAEAGFYPHIAQESSQIAGLICQIAAGLFVALIPSNLSSLIHPQVKYLPVSDNSAHLWQEVSIAWRTIDDNPAITAFLNTAQKE